MPTMQLDSTLTMFYEDDCFADPWRNPETVLLIHGLPDSSQVWYAWVPRLARDLRVLRADLRGFGRSTVPPMEFKWSIEGLAADLAQLLDSLEIDSVHVVGAKIGGSVAYQFAIRYPERTRTLSVISGPARGQRMGSSVDLRNTVAQQRELGIRKWAAESNKIRFGSRAPQAMVDWWTDLMSAVEPRSLIDATSMAIQTDLTESLSSIKAPTLLVTTDRSPLLGVETVREWQHLIPNARLLVLPGDSWHPAATHADECARHVLAFIREHASTEEAWSTVKSNSP